MAYHGKFNALSKRFGSADCVTFLLQALDPLNQEHEYILAGAPDEGSGKVLLSRVVGESVLSTAALDKFVVWDPPVLSGDNMSPRQAAWDSNLIQSIDTVPAGQALTGNGHYNFRQLPVSPVARFYETGQTATSDGIIASDTPVSVVYDHSNATFRTLGSAIVLINTSTYDKKSGSISAICIESKAERMSVLDNAATQNVYMPMTLYNMPPNDRAQIRTMGGVKLSANNGIMIVSKLRDLRPHRAGCNPILAVNQEKQRPFCNASSSSDTIQTSVETNANMSCIMLLDQVSGATWDCAFTKYVERFMSPSDTASPQSTWSQPHNPRAIDLLFRAQDVLPGWCEATMEARKDYSHTVIDLLLGLSKTHDLAAESRIAQTVERQTRLASLTTSGTPLPGPPRPGTQPTPTPTSRNARRRANLRGAAAKAGN